MVLVGKINNREVVQAVGIDPGGAVSRTEMGFGYSMEVGVQQLRPVLPHSGCIAVSRRGEHAIVIIRIHQHPKRLLMDAINTESLTTFFFSLCQYWQEQSSQYSKDRDHHQEFYKRESQFFNLPCCSWHFSDHRLRK